MKLLRRNDYRGRPVHAGVRRLRRRVGPHGAGADPQLGPEGAYQLGTAYGHIAIGVPDIYGTCEELEAEGVKIPRPPGPMKHGTTVIAFIEDPDGYKVELIERS